MTRPSSCIYAGTVVHQRFAPRRHFLRYRMVQILFDLDELPTLGRRLRLFSHGGFNVFSFHDTDHGDGSRESLRGYAERILVAAGISFEIEKIRLLCIPRIFGHAFNPLSIYYCYKANDTLAAMIYEVNNTFGERHTYIIPADKTLGGVISQHCSKKFFVSPFMGMDMNYDFNLTVPGETITTAINGSDHAGVPLIFAAFTGQRRELTDHSLLNILFAYPFLTLGVVAAIHWEALKLFLKGVRLRSRPLSLPTGVTIGGGPSSSPRAAG